MGCGQKFGPIKIAFDQYAFAVNQYVSFCQPMSTCTAVLKLCELRGCTSIGASQDQSGAPNIPAECEQLVHQ